MECSARKVALVCATVGLTLLVEHLVWPRVSPTLTTTGRHKARNEKAFVLSVGLHFTSASAAEAVIREWSRVAEHCLVNEPFLYHYEFAQSDQEPLKYMMYERYRSKDDYAGAHRKSKAFHKFRPILRAMQERGEVTVTGTSYQELGVGFT